MKQSRWFSALCLCLFILAGAGCSSSDGPTQAQLVEAELEGIMQIIINIFSIITTPPPAPEAAVPQGVCTDIPNVCLEGTARDCGGNSYEIDSCELFIPNYGTVVVDGDLLFSGEWPTSQPNLAITIDSLSYGMIFNGTSTAMVDVVDGDVMASCSVEMAFGPPSSADATCMIDDPMVP